MPLRCPCLAVAWCSAAGCLGPSVQPPDEPTVLTLRVAKDRLQVDGWAATFTGSESAEADAAIGHAKGWLSSESSVIVMPDDDADARYVARALLALNAQLTVELRGLGPRTALRAGPKSDASGFSCWHAIIEAPTGNVVVVPATDASLTAPGRRLTVVHGEERTSCRRNPLQASLLVERTPSRCGAPSIVPAPGADWRSTFPFLQQIPHASLLARLPDEPPAAASGATPSPPRSAPCGAGSLPEELGSP